MTDEATFISEPPVKYPVRLSIVPRHAEAAAVFIVSQEDAVEAVAAQASRDLSEPQTILLKHSAGIVVVNLDDVSIMSIEGKHTSPDTLLKQVEDLSS